MKRGKPRRTKSKTKKITPRHKPAKTKQKMTVTITRKVFGKTPEKYTFNLTDGRKLASVHELIDELETMADETFKQYVTEADNHFANWIEHVLGERSLADEIRHIHDRIETQRAILKHLVRELTKEASK